MNRDNHLRCNGCSELLSQLTEARETAEELEQDKVDLQRQVDMFKEMHRRQVAVTESLRAQVALLQGTRPSDLQWACLLTYLQTGIA